MKVLYKNSLIRVEVEKSEVPWIKIFLQEPYSALMDATQEVKSEVVRVIDVINQEMIDCFHPDKINIINVGSRFPYIHWHVVARFEDDSFYPEPMWGERQREGGYRLERLNDFIKTVKSKL